ncbi:Adhesion defective protein 1 [Escovopsis weberi]|uniref:Adhesion defective protein 1 n=1 Tax=Escovopsis weberi TaxID=150374 RepID=A0A0M9VT65_ESCWE|nr:Adhesion defective protein 1 [Escovopsis weberi]
MATSMGPNFTGHPAMGHPGVGHPMVGPGMPPNAAQQGAPGGGMPHQFAAGHLAVSGPGAQVNPAMMGGMPPGPNHNAHALQHMNPAQQQMYQQQHLQNQFNNPSAMAAMRQQQLLQQQHNNRIMAQQFQAANMQGVHSMPLGVPLNQLTPQQINTLRQAGRLPVAHNPMLAQQLAFQQQQQHAQAQAAQAQAQAQAVQAQHAQAQAQQQAQSQVAHGQQMPGAHNPAQHMQMGAQGMHNMQQQNPMAAAGQAPMGGQQPGQQPPGQPQSQQPGGPQSQQGPPQSSQTGTPGNTGQQTPSQTPAPAPIQANQMAQGQGQVQPPQGQPQAQQQMNNVAAQHQLAMNAILQQQHQNQRREHVRSTCQLRLLQLSERLNSFPGNNRKDDLSYWNQFVARFFASPNGVFRHSLHFSSDSEDAATDKQYEISFPAIARYFHTHFGSGVKSMQLLLDGNSSDRLLQNDCYCLENPKASFVYWFENGTHLVAHGTLRAQFDSEQKLEVFEFSTTEHEEYISRKTVIDAAMPAHLWIKEWHKANSIDSKQSPEMSKKGKARQLKSPQKEPPKVLGDLPPSAVNNTGVTGAVHQFLEIVEVMGQMNPLFGFYHGNPGLSPYAALEQYVSTQITNATPVMNGQAMQGGPRTPNFGQFSMGTSPAAVHMNLPGSPHIGSPATGQMQAPVKAEEDTTGAGTPAVSGQVNGIQRGNKPPTPRMPKRIKGNPS